jgi:hypothetical protein
VIILFKASVLLYNASTMRGKKFSLLKVIALDTKEPLLLIIIIDLSTSELLSLLIDMY